MNREKIILSYDKKKKKTKKKSYRTALHACDLVASDLSFLFPSMYKLFMQYLAERDVDVSDVCMYVCVYKSR